MQVTTVDGLDREALGQEGVEHGFDRSIEPLIQDEPAIFTETSSMASADMQAAFVPGDSRQKARTLGFGPRKIAREGGKFPALRQQDGPLPSARH